MNPEQADEALRDLFRAAGTAHAPGRFEARVMARLRPEGSTAAVKPLLPRWAWGIGIALLAMLLFLLAGGSHASSGTPWSPLLDLGAGLPSDRLMMGTTCGALLLALHFWLDRRFSTAVH